MRTGIILFYISLLVLTACKESTSPFIENKLNEKWLEEIIHDSDSSYSKRYFRSDFVTASYYINKKQNSLCQVMRDSSERVRQVIVTKNEIRTFFAQYYPDGQAIAVLHLDKNGKFSGSAELFYPNGKTESKGKYAEGLRIGVWEMYDEEGKLIRKEKYDSGGQILETFQY